MRLYLQKNSLQKSAGGVAQVVKSACLASVKSCFQTKSAAKKQKKRRI
jgi:hypothetical protein